MSVISLLAQNEMDENNEQLLEKAKINMKEIRPAAVKHPTLGEAIIDSVAGPKLCLTQVLPRLKLKVESFNAIIPEAMEQFLTILKQVDEIIVYVY